MTDELARVKRIGKRSPDERGAEIEDVVAVLRARDLSIAEFHAMQIRVADLIDSLRIKRDDFRAQNAELLAALKACITIGKHAAFGPCVNGQPNHAHRRLIEINGIVDTAIAMAAP